MEVFFAGLALLIVVVASASVVLAAVFEDLGATFHDVLDSLELEEFDVFVEELDALVVDLDVLIEELDALVEELSELEELVDELVGLLVFAGPIKELSLPLDSGVQLPLPLMVLDDQESITGEVDFAEVEAEVCTTDDGEDGTEETGDTVKDEVCDVADDIS